MHPNIYVVGAQCSGKTTLIQGLMKALDHNEEGPDKPMLISEVARQVMQKNSLETVDVFKSQAEILKLQQLILEAQYNAEAKADNAWIISDRSGMDPIVYASALAGGDASADQLRNSEQWKYLQTRMRSSLVVVCQPNPEWLQADGTRYMPKGQAAWFEFHDLFCRMLRHENIPFEELPNIAKSLDQRVGMVLSWFDKLRCESDI